MAKFAQRLIARYPLGSAWLAGLVLRWASAIIAVGFFGRDDYFHVLDIALAWIEDPEFVWETSERAGAGIRSHLFPRVVQGLLVTADAMGFNDPVSRLRFVYIVVGTYSSLLVPAVWMLCSTLGSNTRIIAAWLAATHFLLPYAGTRLLIESVAMVPLAFGFAFLMDEASGRKAFFAGLLIGLACWLRYQVAVMGLAAALVLGLRNWRLVGWLATGAALVILAQGIFDVFTFGAFLGPVRNNIAANLHPHAGLTRSGPFGYLAFWLLLTLPPVSIALLPLLARAARRLPMLSVPFLAFVLFHSLVPHKEERFMLPAMPLFVVLLAFTPDILAHAKGRFFDWMRRYQGVFTGAFMGINAVGLGVASTAQSQSNVRDAMLSLRDDGQATGLVSMGPELQTFFLDRNDLAMARTSKPDFVWLGRVFADMKRSDGARPNRFMCFEPDCDAMELMLLSLAFRCETPERFTGFWADRIAYRINAKHNRRRAPVHLYRCERPAFASSQKLHTTTQHHLPKISTGLSNRVGPTRTQYCPVGRGQKTRVCTDEKRCIPISTVTRPNSSGVYPS